MRARRAKPLAFAAFLLGTTALIDPALAQNVVNASGLSATNSDNAYATATFGESQTIGDVSGTLDAYGILNMIGASAAGALAPASVNQTISQSTIASGSTVMSGNTVTVTGTITATNNTTVTPVAPATANIEADVAISPGFALIGSAAGANTGGGMGNTIGATATGAAAQATIVQSLNNDSAKGSTTDLTTLAANAVTATVPITANNTTASVLATLNPGSSGEINDGIGNAISAQAIGASAAASISTRQLDTTTAATAGSPTPSTNTITTGALIAGNGGTVTATAFDGSSTATIDNGIGNMIGASATGTAAGAAIGQAVLFTATPTATTNQAALGTVFGNTVSSGALSATNLAGGTVYASIGDTTAMFSGSPVTATISDGLGNSIAAQALGASAGAAITQSFENVTFAAAPTGFGTAPAANSVTVDALSASNLANVTAFAGVVSSTISTGIGNSITASAVGATASVSVTQSLYNDIFTGGATLGNNTVTSHSPNGIVAINGQSATPGPAVAAPVQATFDMSGGATIAGGIGNVIGASAVGASASAAINQSIGGDPLGMSTGDLTLLGSNSVTVTAANPATSALSATNTGNSPVTATVSQAGLVNIEQSVGGSFSAQAIGATVSASIASHVYNTTVSTVSGSAVATNSVDTTGGVAGGGSGNLTASNNGAITASLAGTGSGANDEITEGVGNFLGASAVGAAAGASISQTAAIIKGNTTPTLPELQVATLSLPANSVTTGALSATNSGSVNSQIIVTGEMVGFGLAPGQLGVGNSIAAQAVGASAGASILSQMYGLDNFSVPSGPATPATNTITVTTITATNSGPVVAQADVPPVRPQSRVNFLDGFNGVGNFIGASAVGASAGAAITQTVSGIGLTLVFDLSQLPGNAVQAGAVVASNTGSVTASLTGPDSVTIGLTPGPASGMVGNSMSAQAVGASAGVSIAAQVFDTQIQPATTTLSTNTVTVASLTSTNSAPVTATATFGIAGTVAAPALIGGGVGNSIGASATGAASLASINQVVDFSSGGAGALAALNTLPVNSVTAGPIQTINNAGGTTTASITMVGTGLAGAGNAIRGGVGNSITATAIGASAGASIAQTVSVFH